MRLTPATMYGLHGAKTRQITSYLGVDLSTLAINREYAAAYDGKLVGGDSHCIYVDDDAMYRTVALYCNYAAEATRALTSSCHTFR